METSSFGWSKVESQFAGLRQAGWVPIGMKGSSVRSNLQEIIILIARNDEERHVEPK